MTPPNWRIALTLSILFQFQFQFQFQFLRAKFTPDWKSLDSRPNPQWWNDAKFGSTINFTSTTTITN
jgi:hypothetical protein